MQLRSASHGKRSELKLRRDEASLDNPGHPTNRSVTKSPHQTLDRGLTTSN